MPAFFGERGPRPEEREQILFRDFFTVASLFEELDKFAPPKVDEIVSQFRSDFAQKAYEGHPVLAARARMPKEIKRAYPGVYKKTKGALNALFKLPLLQAQFKKRLGVELHSLKEVQEYCQSLLRPFAQAYEAEAPAVKDNRRIDPNEKKKRLAKILKDVKESETPSWSATVEKLRLLPGDHQPLLDKDDRESAEALFALAEPRKEFILEGDYFEDQLVDLHMAIHDAGPVVLKISRDLTPQVKEKRIEARRLKTEARKAKEEEARIRAEEKARAQAAAEAKRVRAREEAMARAKAEGREYHEYGDLIESEKQRLQEFFGRSIDVPPLPSEITPELIEFWKQNDFKLEFEPSEAMTEDNIFPGWQHKPGKRHTPGQRYGIEFFDEAERIQNLPENTQNPNLQGLTPLDLPGAWVLKDTRAKPNYTDDTQPYANDALIQGVLKDLVARNIVNKEAAQGLRNKIHPNVFKKIEFWNAIKVALKLDQIPNAIVRLPRTIEANVMGQGSGFHDTNTLEWDEEYYQSGKRVISGSSVVHGGASYVRWGDRAGGYVGFRPLVVFPNSRP